MPQVCHSREASQNSGGHHSKKLRGSCSMIMQPGDSPPRVALCLYGEARQFELTGLSLKNYVLDVLPDAHVFLHAPLDRDSYKLEILRGVKSRFAKARLFTPARIPETNVLREVVGAEGSSHGLQGLLHFFRLIEGCGDLVTDYERKHEFLYDWIIKVRLDSYWTDPIPTKYERGVYTIPFGNNCGGVNDKLGVGDRATAMATGLKLSILPALHAQGDRNLWPEALFESHLELQRILAVPTNFSFCLIDHRKWPWPPKGWHLSVPSISSKGPLNGAYCRPCNPKVSSLERSSAIVESLCKRSGWFPTDGMEKLELCDASSLEWERGWEALFDSAAGQEAAKTREKFAGSKQLQDCVLQASLFQKRWEIWDGPSPQQVCSVKSGNPWPKSSPTSS
ncbi:uncharacterized protein LOC9635372 [Selaginella moellendorffii]|nr:uncharacterized protein LOC9635372 [Selaginella moellendorffii]|eukprot:XP_002967343.2 uncharacterized protein LOC9635372 [Selaginella moellendorffii]